MKHLDKYGKQPNICFFILFFFKKKFVLRQYCHSFAQRVHISIRYNFSPYRTLVDSEWLLDRDMH